MILFIKLLLAHLLGDFVFQFTPWIADKQKRKIKSPYLYLHIGIHFLLILLITWDLGLWRIAAIIAVSHYIIDLGKLYISSKRPSRQWPFFVDQLLHILVLMSVVFFGRANELFLSFQHIINWKLLTAYVFLSLPAGIIIDKCLANWSVEEAGKASLPQAGKLIGILERLLVLTFILLNHWEAIGFLITAKSVFRFNDLKIADRKLTEYILIGTLLSFGIAIFTGVLAKFIL